MAQAEINETLNVDRDQLYEVITRYEDYPRFVTGCREVRVESPRRAGRASITRSR